MWLGRYQLGQTVPLRLQCRNAASVAFLPSQPPLAKVFGASGLVRSKAMPILDRYVITGLFQLPLYLDGQFAPGLYESVYHFTDGSYYGIEVDNFEVVGGGNAAGAIVSMHWYERPHAAFVVAELETGNIFAGRNPRV